MYLFVGLGGLESRSKEADKVRSLEDSERALSFGVGRAKQREKKILIAHYYLPQNKPRKQADGGSLQQKQQYDCSDLW
jgi:hypothetical protein